MSRFRDAYAETYATQLIQTEQRTPILCRLFTLRISMQKKIEEESIFMKNLAAAKRSASHHASDETQCIEIKDLMEKTLTRYDEGSGWKDTPKEA